MACRVLPGRPGSPDFSKSSYDIFSDEEFFSDAHPVTKTDENYLISDTDVLKLPTIGKSFGLNPAGNNGHEEDFICFDTISKKPCEIKEKPDAYEKVTGIFRNFFDAVANVGRNENAIAPPSVIGGMICGLILSIPFVGMISGNGFTSAIHQNIADFASSLHLESDELARLTYSVFCSMAVFARSALTVIREAAPILKGLGTTVQVFACITLATSIIDVVLSLKDGLQGLNFSKVITMAREMLQSSGTILNMVSIFASVSVLAIPSALTGMAASALEFIQGLKEYREHSEKIESLKEKLKECEDNFQDCQECEINELADQHKVIDAQIKDAEFNRERAKWRMQKAGVVFLTSLVSLAVACVLHALGATTLAVISPYLPAITVAVAALGLFTIAAFRLYNSLAPQLRKVSKETGKVQHSTAVEMIEDAGGSGIASIEPGAGFNNMDSALLKSVVKENSLFAGKNSRLEKDENNLPNKGLTKFNRQELKKNEQRWKKNDPQDPVILIFSGDYSFV
jgi:hypothetical protein